MTQSSEAHKQIPPSNLNIKIMHLNAQSCCNKSLELADTIVEERFDMVLLSETWFKEVGDEPRLVELTPKGFVLKKIASSERQRRWFGHPVQRRLGKYGQHPSKLIINVHLQHV